ncbi:MAG: type II toxin-antitoxin system HicA family toxin [Gammaproteobacteria bacterium]|nr:type II toxin-antitoxin system HicA family toxin [Gammaproteobacteria bacterium]
MKKRKLLQKLLSDTKDVRFCEALAVAEAFGFRLDRINGSYHIFVHPDILELLNLQELKGNAKPYQINQMLELVEIHNIQLRDS